MRSICRAPCPHLLVSHPCRACPAMSNWGGPDAAVLIAFTSTTRCCWFCCPAWLCPATRRCTWSMRCSAAKALVGQAASLTCAAAPGAANSRVCSSLGAVTLANNAVKHVGQTCWSNMVVKHGGQIWCSNTMGQRAHEWCHRARLLLKV